MTPARSRAALAAFAALALAAFAAPTAAPADERSGGTAASEQQRTSTAKTGKRAGAARRKRGRRGKLTRGTIRRAQRALGVTADGVIGPRTRAAIRRFQRRSDLRATGRLNRKTLRALGVTPRRQRRQRRDAATPRTAPAGDTEQAQHFDAATVQAAMDAARSKIGAPYASGGNGPDSFDCSGLMVWAFEQAGANLPRTSYDQYGLGAAVEQADIQPGDLVFFSTAGSGASHVGIAVSPTSVISTTSGGVKEHAIDDSYWGSNYVGARRLVTAS